MTSRNAATAAVHPLVLLNISEHATRTLAQTKHSKQEPGLVCGALLGRQKESRTELFHSFELVFRQPRNDGTYELDSTHYLKRMDHMRQIFPEDDLVGWYFVSSSLRVTRLMCTLHQQIMNLNATPLLLVFDAAMAGQGDEEGGSSGLALPVAVYETQAPAAVPRAALYGDAMDDEDPAIYVEGLDTSNTPANDQIAWASRLEPLRIAVETGEAERVAIDHVANVSTMVSDETMVGGAAAKTLADASKIAMFLTGQRNALEMLHKDIRILQAYVSQVIAGTAPYDPDVLQLVKRVLCNRPVVLDDALFNKAMAQEETNYEVAAYLGAITSAVGSVRNVAQRANAALQAGRNKHMPLVSHGPGGSMFDGFDMMHTMGGFGRSGRSHGFGSLR
ncbi:hypothetical protein EC988_004514 [Linderina pennispora]|nr:hypothetical protein EC988_004514 [Linderina pennispora]